MGRSGMICRWHPVWVAAIAVALVGTVCAGARGHDLIRAVHLDQGPSGGSVAGIEPAKVTKLYLNYAYSRSIKTVADDGTPYTPYDVAVDSDGNIYVTHTFGVDIYDKSGSYSGTIGHSKEYMPGGMAYPEHGELIHPFGIALSDSAIWLADGCWLQEYGIDGTYLGSLDLTNTSTAPFSVLIGVAVSSQSGSVFVVNSQKPGVISLTTDGQEQTAWGSKGGGDGQFTVPRFIAVSKSGAVAVDDDELQRIEIFDEDGTFVKSFGKTGSDDDAILQPEGIAFDSHGNVFVVTSSTVKAYTKDGVFLGSLPNTASGGAQPPRMLEATGIALDSSDNIYVANTNHKTIDIYTRQASASTPRL